MTFSCRFTALIFCALFSLYSSSEANEAKVAVFRSSAQGLSLRLAADGQMDATATGVGQATAAERTWIDAADGSAREAYVICFYSPNRNLASLVAANVTVGGKALRPVENSVVENVAEVAVVAPVLVRGRWVGKVVVPVEAQRGGTYYEVTAAEVELAFSGEPELREERAAGPLDRLLDELAVNAEQAAAWTQPLRKSAGAAVYNPFALSGSWVRIAVTESGLYKITRSDLTNAGVSMSGVDPRTLRLFHAGGKPLPVSNATPRDSLTEVAIAVAGEADGNFGNDDYVMFYGNGGDFWESQAGPAYVRHPYSDRNVYYLAIGGTFPEPARRMGTVSGDRNDVIDTVSRTIDYLHFEEEAQFSQSGDDVFDYYNWYWGLAGDLTLFVNLPQPAPQSVNRFRIKTTRQTFNLKLNNFDIARDSSVGLVHFYTSNRLTNGLNQFSIDYAFNDGYTDYLEVELERDLNLPASGQLLFFGRRDGNAHAYRIAGSFQTPIVVDVADAQAPVVIAPVQVDGSQLFIDHGASTEVQTVLAVSNLAALKTPFAVVATQVDDIRAESNQADYIIVTHDNFYANAVNYAAYRQLRDGLRTRVVRISDVYAQFAGGRVDPVAIRDFLRYTHEHWSGARPSYCLLAGDGVYDFRNNLGTGGVNYVPPYIVAGDETVSDENFVYLDSLYDLDADDSYPSDRGVDMVIARWAVKTAAEFETVAAKIKAYDEAADAGNWRNIITLIADDEKHPQSTLPEVFHTQDTEVLAGTIIPPGFVLDKIYGIAYPLGAASEKPEMREAIIRAINAGRLIVNYTGHGNPNLWADERIFRRVQDIPRLNNAARLPLIFNASCSIGFFDNPQSEGMAEDLLRYANGGAVGTISATRLVYSRPNFEFNKAGMTQLLSDKNYTIAEAVYVTKLLRQGVAGVGDNDRKYIYMGDPLSRLALAPNQIDFVTFAPDSLVALTVTDLAGAIEDQDGIKQSDFDGEATISVFDNQRTRTFVIPPFTVSYAEYGPEIYRGRVAVRDGDFNLKFVVPKDISYGGREARISGYAASATSGAAGVIYPIAIGSINKETVDSTGPTVSVYFAGNPQLSNGATLKQNSEVTVELYDSLGINLTGEIGHGIELTIDERPEFAFAVTDSFTYDPDSYQRGRATMVLPVLADGPHQLQVKAWDSANNSSLATVDFNVNAAAGIEITDLLCYPNPVAEACEFSYSLSADADHVILKLFTLSGLEIWSKTGLPASRGAHQGIAWDGRDADGDRPANGVYLFQLSARAASAGASGDDNSKAVATGKLVVLK